MGDKLVKSMAHIYLYKQLKVQKGCTLSLEGNIAYKTDMGI
jgi:hypothetical protein